MKAKVVWAILVTLVLGACGTAPARKAQVTPRPSASAELTDEQWRVAWANWGIAPPPPRNVAEQLKPTLPPVRNATGGKISDAEAQAWVLALYRTTSIEEWEVSHLHSELLSSPANPTGDSNASIGLYQGVLRLVARQKASGAVELVADLNPRLVDASVSVVPPSLRGQVSPPKSLSVYVVTTTVEGPSRAFARLVDGRQIDLPGLRPGRRVAEVESGEFRTDPILGPIWYRTSEYECASEPTLASLCA